MSGAWFALLLQLSALVPPSAIDHVVRLEQLDRNGVPGGDRHILYRSGSLVRTDWMSNGRDATTYTDLASGLEVSASHDNEGVVQRVTIDRPFNRWRRLPPRGRQDILLGESCTISRLVHEGMSTGTEICETADGILLWEAFWYPQPADRTIMYRRATSVERRLVRPEELLPPRTLLALASEPPPAASADAAEPDHEVEMVGHDPEDGSYVQRRHGRFFSNVRRAQGEHIIYIGNGAVSVNYKENDAGRPLSLEITRAGFHPFHGVVPRWERVPRRAPVRLLGETCIWQDEVAIQSTDRQYYCRTADGIILKTETWFHWTGRRQRFTARRLSRGPLRDADFAPPARALDWAHWGITPSL